MNVLARRKVANGATVTMVLVVGFAVVTVGLSSLTVSAAVGTDGAYEAGRMAGETVAGAMFAVVVSIALFFTARGKAKKAKAAETAKAERAAPSGPRRTLGVTSARRPGR